MTKETIKKNLIKFGKKFFWRLLSRVFEIAVLFAIGYSLGLKLVRY